MRKVDECRFAQLPMRNKGARGQGWGKEQFLGLRLSVGITSLPRRWEVLLVWGFTITRV